jgi:predicted transcriptional regulator
MAGGRTLAEYVIGSTVRAGVLRAIADGANSIEELLASLEASESAVYGAVSELETRGLLTELDEGYELTGTGRLVTDLVDQLDRMDELFATDAAYWESHELSVLPEQFRTRLPELAGCEIIRATEADPHRVVRHVTERIEDAERVSIVTPIYQDEYATGLPHSGEVELLFDESILDEFATEPLASGADPPPGAETRVGDVSFALTVTDSCLLLSLPLLDGQYDTRTELVAEHEAAMRWGQQLFEYVWEQGVPVEDSPSGDL